MNNLKLNVIGNRIEITKDTYSTQGSVNFDSCTFTFDSEWDSFEKTAVFGFGNSDCVRVTLEDNTCAIPALCMQKQGFIRIGVYGINPEGTVIATNAVAHRVDEGVGNLDDWFEEDRSFVYNALAEIEGSLDEYKRSLDRRFERLSESVGDTALFAGEPDDWYSPVAFTDAESIPSGIKGSAYEEYFDYILNKLTEDYPQYVTSSQIGTDSSGIYPIYAYTFAPENYEKTLFVTSCLDGNESFSLIALSAFLNDLCRNHHTSRALSYIRSKVKLVVLPTGNPYGLVNRVNYNSNNVRINRNFPFRWSDSAEAGKGSAVADQSETAAISALLDSLSDDKLCAVVNFKDCANIYYCSKMLFYPRFRDNCLNELSEMLDRFNHEVKDESDLLSKYILAPTLNPTLVNFAAERYGVNACTLGFVSINYGGADSNEAVTKFNELIGNTILTLAKSSTYTCKGTKVPFTKYYSWRSSDDEDVYTVAQSPTLKRAPITSFEISPEAPCNISLSGYAILKADSACNFMLNPVLWQDNSPEQTYSERLSMRNFTIEAPLTVGTHIIPFETVLQAYRADTNGMISSGYPEKVCFSVALCADTASAVSLIGFSVTLNVFESNVGSSVEINKPLGYATDYTSQTDVPTFRLIYPAETVTDGENDYHD